MGRRCRIVGPEAWGWCSCSVPLLMHVSRRRDPVTWLRSPLQRRIGVMCSELRVSTTRMPYGQNHKLVTMNAVVDKVPNATKMQPTHTFQAHVADLDSSAGLAEKQYEGALEVCPEGARRGRSVFEPPSFGPLYLGRSAVCNAQTQRHGQRMRSSRAKSSSAEMVAPRSASAMASRSCASSSAET